MWIWQVPQTGHIQDELIKPFIIFLPVQKRTDTVTLRDSNTHILFSLEAPVQGPVNLTRAAG